MSAYWRRKCQCFKFILYLVIIMIITGYFKLYPRRFQHSSFTIDTGLSEGVENESNRKTQELQPSVIPTMSSETGTSQDLGEVVLASVVCGNGTNLEELFTLVKSAIIFQTTSRIRFIVVSEFNLHPILDEKLQHFKRLAKNSFTYQLLNISSSLKNQEVFALYEKTGYSCSTQRLHFPIMLKNENLVLYLDTDTIFLNEVSTMWNMIYSMNTQHLAAVVLEGAQPTHYAEYAKRQGYPIFGAQGLNAGVMLMNLNRMREFNWMDHVTQITLKYNSRLRFPDQDIVNIFFRTYPDKLYNAPCIYNYVSVYCFLGQSCPGFEKNGPSLIHGSGKSFEQPMPVKEDLFYYLPTSDPGNLFYYFYKSFLEYELGTDIHHNLIQPLERRINKLEKGLCRHKKNAFLKNLIRLYPKP